MKQEEELYTIHDFHKFFKKIKKEVLKTFIYEYSDSQDFIEKYDEDLLTSDIIQYDCRRYLIFDEENQQYHIFKGDIERVIKAVYKELVEQVLNKLVDEGKLELCWDKRTNNFIWRQLGSDKRGRRRSKKEGRRRF